MSPDVNGNVQISVSNIGLINPTAVAASTDLNTMQTTGLFFVTDSVATTLVNSPSSIGGILEIEPFTTTASGGDVIQTFKSATGIFWRRYQSGSATWTSWSAAYVGATIPVATTTSTGVVQVGSGLAVTNTGVLSANVLTVAGKTGNVTLVVADVGGAAPLVSPTFTGTPTAPPPTTGDNSTKVATTAFVQTAVAPLGGPTSSRPSSPVANMMYVDTTLGYPIWYISGQWVNSSGFGPV